MSSDRFPTPSDFPGPSAGFPPPPGGPGSYHAGRRKSKHRTLLLVFVIVGLCLFAGVALIVGIGALYIFTATEEEVTAQDRRVIVDIRMLAATVEDYTPDPAHETIVKQRYIDRSYDVDYEYDAPDDPDEPYLNCCVAVERNHNDAVASYVTVWEAARLGMIWGADVDVEIVERNELFSWGDQSRFAIFKADGQPCGNVFVARKGNVVFYLIFSGIYFDDGEAFAELVRPALSNIENLPP